MGEKGPVYEVERDRHAVMYSGPLEVGECIRVVPAEEVEWLRDAIERHRETWQRSNGTDPNNARPADLALWAAAGLEPSDG